MSDKKILEVENLRTVFKSRGQEVFAGQIAEQKKMLADACSDMSDEISSQIYTFGQMRNLYEK